MGTTTTVDEERAKLIMALLKIGASKAPGDKAWTAEEVEEIFGSYDAAVEADFLASEKQEVAGPSEIKSFAEAATAINSLSETMRLRVLRALDALMLPPPERKPLLPPEVLKAITSVVPGLLEALAAPSSAVQLDSPGQAAPAEGHMPPGYTKVGTVVRTPQGTALLVGVDPSDAFLVPEDWVRQALASFEERRRRVAGEPIVTPPPKPDGEV